VFLAVGILNAVVATYIFALVPEYLLRFIAFVVARVVYRFQVRGDENIPGKAPRCSSATTSASSTRCC
jgi:1-acyl-sn-glycerol-3-phosphate acyltransferase